MLLPIAVLLLVSQPVVHATVFSYSMEASESPCFFSWVDTAGQKIAFYFAVSN
jgi:hypothetical protein